jgi:hypothetical protein
MPVPNMRGSLLLATCAITLALAVAMVIPAARADEIRLKDGKILYGVIVAYEDSMFKVKTDFGYVLVEKDKIASIIPSTPADKTEAQPATAKDTASHPAKPDAGAPTEVKPAAASVGGSSAGSASTNAKTANPTAATVKAEKTTAKITNVAVKPEVPATAAIPAAVAPAIKGPAVTPANALAANAPPTPLKEPEVPAVREEVQGNLYINYTHSFKMYKAPSWNLIEEARSALPNAIVAMGTSNESTLMVVGEESTKEPLEAAAAGVEKRLHDVYSKYQRVSQSKTVVGGLPAVEYQYRGSADDHDWSGRLVVVARGKDLFTVLAMTYADSDLIQIQENVIARSIASLDFSVH